MKKAFDRFADLVAEQVANPWFFSFCVLLVVLWIPTMFVMSVDSSQLIINTATTIITFLLVALLHNTQHRFENATDCRLQELLDKLDGAIDPVEKDPS